MAGISANYDPVTTAQALAESSTAAQQAILTRQSQEASATQKALGTLGSVLSAFQSTLASLTGLNKTMSANSAIFSDTGVASATASPTAAAGSYAFFVQRLASAHRVAYSGLQDFTMPADDKLTLSVGGSAFSVDLKAGTIWTPRDLAAAINGATGNTTVSASVITTGTDAQGNAISELVLTSKLTGTANGIVLSTTNGATGFLETTLGTGKDLSDPLDAIVRVGSSNGTEIFSATNTLNVIDGVTMTLTKAQAFGSEPVTLTVASDASKTTSNVQAFVDAYNKLKSAVDALVTPGDPTSNASAGAFARDSGVRALRDKLVSLIRGTGATTLAGYGIIANREGTLSVDSARLTKALAANPTGLDTLIGSSAATASSGIAGQLDTYLKLWTNGTKGQIDTRKSAIERLQSQLTNRQAILDRQYDSAYTRFLSQFTQLQTVQSSMSYNTSLFDALFSSSKD